MRVDKYVAKVGLNVCMAVFISLSAYGIFSYMNWEQSQSQSPDALTMLFYGIAVAGSIVGICFFGIQMDRRRYEESKSRHEESRRKKR